MIGVTEDDMSELLDNSRYRIDALKEIIHRLHDGADPGELTESFGELLEEVGASEIAAMESELIREGMPVEEVQRMCDVHAAVLGGKLPATAPSDAVPGHPVHTFRLENERIRDIVARYRELGERMAAARQVDQAAWQKVHDELAAVDGHFKRKEYLVFPFLEKAGISAPPKVMWGVHDEIREKVDAAGELVEEAGTLGPEELRLALDSVVRPMLDQIEGMTDKEDRVLWPMAMAHLTVPDWESVRSQWEEFGDPIAKPAGVWMPVRAQVPARSLAPPADEAIRLPSGFLSHRQLVAMLNALPVDITFVGADGRVAYFSEGAERVFERNRAIIGRRVQDCHPPKSVHLVQQVVDELSSGARDVAEFWIQMHGTFVHIRYFAVRDDGGEFLGTLEVTQDITPLRALEGERRLLAEEGSAA